MGNWRLPMWNEKSASRHVAATAQPSRPTGEDRISHAESGMTANQSSPGLSSGCLVPQGPGSSWTLPATANFVTVPSPK